MKHLKIALLCLILWLPAVGQNQKLTLEDAILRRFQLFWPENMQGLSWRPGTGNYTYVKDNEVGIPVLHQVSAKKGKSSELFDIDALKNAVKAADLTPPSRMPQPVWHDQNHLFINTGSSTLLFNVEDKSVKPLASWEKGGENLEVHEKTGAVAYTKGKNAYIVLPGKSEQPISLSDEDGTVTNGQAAHRFEFGITKGLFWSPDGKKIAYYRVDEQDVTEYPVINWEVQPAQSEMVRYPMAGAKSHYAQLCIYNTETGKTACISPRGDKEDYLTNISWSPDSKSLFIAELNRDQNHMHFNHYKIDGSFVKTLFEEKDERYVEPKHPAWFLPGKNDEFLWWSRRDGYMHLYHYNTAGKMLRQIEHGPWEITQIHGMDEDGKNLFLSATSGLGTGRTLWKVEWPALEWSKLTPKEGLHTVIVQPEGEYFIDSYSSTEVARQITVVSSKGKQVRELLNAKNPLDDYDWGSLKLFSIKAKDGSDLWCRMFLPPNFDPNKKYPVIDYVYGGPGVQLVYNTYNAAAATWMNWAAQEGYIVFTLENRGSANRGAKFEQATFQHLGTVEIEDQLTGVEYLKSLPYVDSDRMAVHGWSFGGFMTTSLMLRAPGTFQVGVAGGPVIDWSMYEIMYTERYMDTPETNKEGYEGASLLNKVDKLEGDLLLIHGTSDDVVLWQHSIAFLQKAIEAGTQVDYFVYPMHPHNVRGKDRLHLMQKVLGYIMDHL